MKKIFAFLLVLFLLPAAAFALESEEDMLAGEWYVYTMEPEYQFPATLQQNGDITVTAESETATIHPDGTVETSDGYSGKYNRIDTEKSIILSEELQKSPIFFITSENNQYMYYLADDPFLYLFHNNQMIPHDSGVRAEYYIKDDKLYLIDNISYRRGNITIIEPGIIRIDRENETQFYIKADLIDQ